MSMSGFNLDLGPTIGALFVGLVLSAAILGISTAQTIYYYRVYLRDKIFLKIMVATLWVLNTASVAMIANALYDMSIEHHMSPLSLSIIPRSLAIEGMVAGVIALIAHIFLIHRIWMLNRNWVILSIILAILSLLDLAIGFVADASGSNLEWSASDKNTMHWALLVSTVTSSVIDVIITNAICLQLYRSRTGFSRTSRIIHHLMLYTIATGFIPTIFTVVILITYLALPPGSTTYVAIEMLIAGAYTNTLLVTLNNREFIGRRAVDTTPGTVLPSMEFRDVNASTTTAFEISSDRARDTLPLEIYVNTIDVIYDTAK